MHFRHPVAIALFVILSSAPLAQTPTNASSKTPAVKSAAKPPARAENLDCPASKNANMQWWRDARFGLFINWGVYNVPAGSYQGKEIPWLGEWIMWKAEIPVAEYRKFAKIFNPVKYDPDAWVRLAKEAGVKYIVVGAKHHDGFALYDSKASDWDVVDATPYGKDLLRPLEQACKKHGMKLGFYYSQAQDWVHPGGAKSQYKEGPGWDKAHDGNFDDYLQKIAYPQLKEILSNYDIDVLWWDTPTWMTKQRADLLLPLLDLQPGIVWNNRLGGGYKGCCKTPEQRIPDTGYDYDWETCMTMNDNWGFRASDHNWKSTERLIHNLVEVVSKGGNFLLNVGPTKEGEIPAPSIERLQAIGRWMKINGDSIHGTTASPFAKPAWGRYTKKPGTLYAHVFDWPKNNALEIPLKNAKLGKVQLLTADGPLTLKTDQTDAGLTIHLPAACPDPIDSVIAVEHSE